MGYFIVAGVMERTVWCMCVIEDFSTGLAFVSTLGI